MAAAGALHAWGPDSLRSDTACVEVASHLLRLKGGIWVHATRTSCQSSHLCAVNEDSKLGDPCSQACSTAAVTATGVAATAGPIAAAAREQAPGHIRRPHVRGDLWRVGVVEGKAAAGRAPRGTL